MDPIKIKETFKNSNKEVSLPLLKSSVLVPIINIHKEPHLLFEVRSHQLKNQPGEVCFPGGKVEPGENFQQSAIRETIEELNIKRQNIELIGRLDPIITTFNMIVYPFCAFLHNIQFEDINYSIDEVDSIFTVPLKHLITQSPLTHKLKISTVPDNDFPFHLIQEGKNYKWGVTNHYIHFYQYENHVIWGVTAKILKNFLEIISR